jgi:hypothetical protein
MFTFERHLPKNAIQLRLQFIVGMIPLILAIAPTTAAQVIPTAGQLQVNGAITMVFTADTVSCSGLSPGDRIALFGFMIDRQSSSQTISTPMFLQSADANGTFSATVSGGIKPRSIWLLIDQISGSYTIAEPAGSVLTRIPDGAINLTGGSIALSAVATINRAHTHAISISDTRQFLENLRPRGVSAADVTPTGFSVIDAKDGSASDEDGTVDGTVHLTLPGFFDQNQNSSCLFVVDDRTLEFGVTYLQFSHAPVCPQWGCS